MKVAFAAVGAENISSEYLSSAIKEKGHQVILGFDRSLFDDKQYFTVKFLANIFSDKKRVIKKIIKFNPDLLAISVFADNYQWSLEIANKVKEKTGCKVIFGGVHPTTVPEIVLKNDCVDFICLGEGEKPLVELLEKLEKSETEFEVKNIWYKKDNDIIKNELRPNLDSKDFPVPDKELFEEYIPIKDYYLTVTSKGCICICSYCSQNFLNRFDRENNLGKFLREKPVDMVIDELVTMKEKYNIKRVDIKNNVLSGSRKWEDEFFSKYKEFVNLPYRIMGHPKLMTKDYCKKLKETGCWHIQLGIESLNPKVREEVLLRNESNEEIIQALDNMEEAGLKFSTDFIVGLPGETEEDIVSSLDLITKYKGLVRASIFWLEYLPGVAITDMAKNKGYINKEDELKIQQGLQEHYMSTGSINEKDRVRFLKSYHILFRLAPITPNWLMKSILKYRLQWILGKIPMQTLVIFFIDVIVSIVKKDHYAIFSIKWYFKELFKRSLKLQFFR